MVACTSAAVVLTSASTPIGVPLKSVRSSNSMQSIKRGGGIGKQRRTRVKSGAERQRKICLMRLTEFFSANITVGPNGQRACDHPRSNCAILKSLRYFCCGSPQSGREETRLLQTLQPSQFRSEARSELRVSRILRVERTVPAVTKLHYLPPTWPLAGKTDKMDGQSGSSRK